MYPQVPGPSIWVRPNAADLLGISDRGEIAPGKLAHLIGVQGNPLEDGRVLQQVIWVMKGGEVVKGAGQQESGEAGK